MEFATIDEQDLEDKKILVRVDINSPIDPKTSEILDDTRIRSHIPTIKSLSIGKTILIAHQSRPGLEDFTTLEAHARRLQEISRLKVRYVDDIFGSAARKAISELENGEVLMLENVRLCSEEVSDTVIKKSPKEQSKTLMVRKLSSYVDFYINDAFAVSHRNQPSIVAFPYVLPSCAGKLMEKEVKTLSRILNNRENPVFIFGGAKVKDSLKVMERLLDNGKVEKILTAGLVATVFLAAKGYTIGSKNKKILEEKGLLELVDEARKLLEKYGEKIEIPVDLALLKNGARFEAPMDKLPDLKIMDIGIETIARYSTIIKKAKIAVLNGPSGMFEVSDFALGTEELVKAVAKSRCFSVLGGGHLSAVAKKLKLINDISYISTGGKATLSFLAGEKLPGIEALRRRK